MVIADMHNDSLCICQESGGNYFSAYNASAIFPHLQFCAAFVGGRKIPADVRRKKALSMADTFSSLSGEGRLIRTRSDLDGFLSGEKRAILFSVEGGAGLDGNEDILPLLYEKGLRVFGLAWDDNELSASSHASGKAEDYGLTPLGFSVLRELKTLGVLPDVSHLSDRAVEDVFENYQGVLLATHSNLRSVHPHPRNLTDAQALEIARRGGVIGVNLYPPFLSSHASATLCDLQKQIDGLLSLVGADAVGCGLDIDGVDAYPVGFSKARSMHDRLYDAVLRTYPMSVAKKIMGDNVIRVLSATLPLK